MSFPITLKRSPLIAPPRTASVLGLGHYLPAEVVPNDRIAERIGVDHDWIVKRTGIHHRRRAAPDERLSDLATRAAHEALTDACADPIDVDLMLVATLSQDELTPNAAPIVAHARKALAAALRDLYPEQGASIVGLDFDASLTWPVYDWMGVAKAALEATARYLARDLGPRGVRVNLVAAGPLGTLAARGIPGFEELAEVWGRQAPLGWDGEDAGPVAGAIPFLLSDLARRITGEILHVDGGLHAMGAPLSGAPAELEQVPA
jgi:NAD(P)-dependent dehydrogenase (short-subunit alcohol dehydrogenase family)